MASVLIAAGGTGGHVHPALALAGVLRERGHEVAFCGGDRMEAALVPEAGFRLHRLPVRGLPRKPSPAALGAGIALAGSVVRARGVLRQIAADVVVGMGGYPSLAPALAAGWGRRPVVLHEQNAKLVLAHRLAVRWAEVLALSLPLEGGTPRRRRLRVETTGNPLRGPIRRLAHEGRAAKRAEARARFDLSPDAVVVLAFGGSQGARRLNEALPGASSGWAEDVEILHLAGAIHVPTVEGAWWGAPRRVVVVGYLAGMEEAYAAADLVVARSGASTVSELAALGLPAVLVPLPHAAGGVQEANARVLDRAGGAVVLEEGRGFEARLRGAVGELLSDPGRLEGMGRAALTLARPEAADGLADLVEGAVARR